MLMCIIEKLDTRGERWRFGRFNIAIQYMSDWPFYFALIILILLISIRTTESFGDYRGIPTTTYNGDTITNIQKSINYGDSEFNKENDSMATQVEEMMKQRDSIITEDNIVRGEIEVCTGNLTTETQTNTELTTNLATCNKNLNEMTTKLQGCTSDVTMRDSRTANYRGQFSGAQTALERCNHYLENGEEPPPPPKPPINNAIQNQIAAQRQRNPVNFYTGKLNQCNAELNGARNEYNRRNPPPPPPPPPPRRGCVIL